jgi:mono/diheme cytochrome c family protein
LKSKLTMALAIVPATLAAAWALAATPPATAQAQAGKALNAKPAAAPAPITVVDRYCIGCHNAKARIGGIAFDTLDRSALGHDAATWEEAIRRLRGHYMPPATARQPSESERQALIAYLEAHLDQAGAASDPGRVPLHRLNRREYANSIRDLIGLDIDPAQWLPQDPLKGDFDTDAASLQVTRSTPTACRSARAAAWSRSTCSRPTGSMC